MVFELCLLYATFINNQNFVIIIMIGCIIQARTGSTRLPGKIMMSIDQNDTVLSFGIKQVKSSKKIDELVEEVNKLKNQ